MAALLGDEDFSHKVCAILRQLGHDVETVSGLNRKSTPDELVLALAQSLNRAVLTFNKWDFIAIHGDVPDHPGIFVCTSGGDRAELAQRIHLAIQQHGDLRGKLIRVNKPA